jgi:predicted nucleic acid-binding protein
MDERKGRRKLTQLNIPKIGTLGILLKAKELGFVPKIKLEIEKLQSASFTISQSVVDDVLKQAGE